MKKKTFCKTLLKTLKEIEPKPEYKISEHGRLAELLDEANKITIHGDKIQIPPNAFKK